MNCWIPHDSHPEVFALVELELCRVGGIRS
jgi:hypothetical protein